jgi:hypothetical protein
MLRGASFAPRFISAVSSGKVPIALANHAPASVAVLLAGPEKRLGVRKELDGTASRATMGSIVAIHLKQLVVLGVSRWGTFGDRRTLFGSLAAQRRPIS